MGGNQSQEQPPAVAPDPLEGSGPSADAGVARSPSRPKGTEPGSVYEPPEQPIPPAKRTSTSTHTSDAVLRFRAVGKKVVKREKEKRNKPRTSQEANLEALAAGGVGAVRRDYEGEATVYQRRFELGFDMSEPVNMYTVKDNAVAIFTEFFCTMLFLFFNVAQLTFLRQGNLTEVTEGNLDSSSRLVIALQFGVSIFVLVYIAAGISGAHINPAVTWGLMCGSRISVPRGCLYIAAQMLGAIVGTAFAKALNPSGFDDAGGGANGLGSGVTQGQGLLAEIFGSMLLVLVVYTATNGYLGSKLAHIPTLLPWAIGMAIFIAHLSLIPITGCGINPARSFGPAVVVGDFTNQWIYWVGPFIGSTIATLLFEFIFRLPEPLDPDDEVTLPPAARAIQAFKDRLLVTERRPVDGSSTQDKTAETAKDEVAPSAESFTPAIAEKDQGLETA